MRRLSLAAAGLALACSLYAQATLEPWTPGYQPVVMTERSDFSKYVNGSYLGHVYREARIDLRPAGLPGGGASYEGDAFVYEETLRDQMAVARRLDGVVPVRFAVSASGAWSFGDDSGYPILRGLPVPPPGPVPKGGRWTGECAIVARPRPEAPATRVRVLAEYEYAGETVYAGVQALSIKARYATRYRGDDRLGDPDLRSSQGSRTADILVDKASGATLFVREMVDETFAYADGSTVRMKGFILHFYKGSVPGDRDRIAGLLGGAPAATASPLPASGGPASSGGVTGAASSPLAPVSSPAGSPVSTPAAPPQVTPPGIAVPAGSSSSPVAPTAAGTSPGAPFELARGERGVILLLYDLRFVADGDELLPSERGRLDAIAQALARIPDQSFLVEGHTADVGKAAGQYELSERRARRIVDELVARGLAASRFVYRGLGADKPIAPNDTEANRARNRRVEITVLD